MTIREGLKAFSTLSPMAYQILWLLWGASEPPPSKISTKESFLTPCCNILGIFWGHIQKITKFEQDFRISKYGKLRFHIALTKQNCYNSHEIKVLSSCQNFLEPLVLNITENFIQKVEEAGAIAV